MMRDGHPGIRRIGCRDGVDLTARHFMSTTVQAEIGFGTSWTPFGELVYHMGNFLSLGCALTRLSGAGCGRRSGHFGRVIAWSGWICGMVSAPRRRSIMAQ